ncbi:MAG: transposase [Paludibacteraceae bacterium]|nr:transposase [Paludibacteraceae bacterium]
MVTYHDSETGDDVEFITNNFEISALEVANLYRHRWDIEVFFKWIKQNIVVKTLWGYSENAAKTHLWVAIIAYLHYSKNQSRLQKPLFNYRSGYVDKDLCTRKSRLRSCLNFSGKFC